MKLCKLCLPCYDKDRLLSLSVVNCDQIRQKPRVFHQLLYISPQWADQVSVTTSNTCDVLQVFKLIKEIVILI